MSSAPAAPSEPLQPSGVAGRLAVAARDIKLAHSVFALPFAILAAFMARDPDRSWAFFAGQLALVVVSMFFARTWAMLINRIADRRFDAANPRTQRRAVAVNPGLTGDFVVIALLAGAAFWLCAALFALFGNWWPAILAPIVLAWIAFYSFTKRFTVLCHVFLGGALAISPLAAALAVRPASLTEVPALYWVAGMVLLWVAGFDVIYALQDVDFDRREGLRSIPARLGWRRAAWVSRALHAGALAALILAWLADPRFGWAFGAAAMLVAIMLVSEHLVLARRGEQGLQMAFFTLNGVISCAIGAVGTIDLFI